MATAPEPAAPAGGGADGQGIDVARALVPNCTGCHGAVPLTPQAGSLHGAPLQGMREAIARFRSGQPSSATIMPQLVAGYDDAQMNAILAWFAAQPARSAQTGATP